MHSAPLVLYLPARRGVRFRVLAYLCVAASIAYVCRSSISIAESTIRADLELSEAQTGWIMSAFYLAYSLGQIPTGWLGGRLGSRRMLALVAVGWSWATLIMSGASSLPVLMAAWLFHGLAQAGLFPAATATLACWFPRGQRALASGLLGGFMSLGAAAGAALTGLLLATGWRTTFALYSMLGVVWAAAFYLWFRDDPQEHPQVSPAELNSILAGSSGSQPSSNSASQRWFDVWLSPATVWISGQQFFRAAGQVFFASWFATFLQETRGVSPRAAGLLNSLPLLALVLGAFCGGSVSDWLLHRTGSVAVARKWLAASCMLLCAILVCVAFTIHDPVAAVLTISLGSFCAAFGGPCAYAITIDMGGRQVPTLFGTMNMCGNLGAFLFINGVPWFLEQTGKSPAGWNAVLLLFAAAYASAGVCWALLRTGGTVMDQRWWASTEPS